MLQPRPHMHAAHVSRRAALLLWRAPSQALAATQRTAASMAHWLRAAQRSRRSSCRCIGEHQAALPSEQQQQQQPAQGGAAAGAAAPPPPAAAAAAAPLPTTALGQVVSTGTKYIRVNLRSLMPDSGDATTTSSTTSSSNGRAGSSSNGRASSSGEASPPLLWPPPPKPQLLCTVRALLKKMQQSVLVGDEVTVSSIDWAAGRGTVTAVAPRASELVDPAVANVDHVVLLFGLTKPPFEPLQVSRFLVSIEAAGLPLTLVLNKADLVAPEEVAERLRQVGGWGYTGLAVSCVTGQGLEQLDGLLAGRISVVAGPSGAGKSSLINALRLGRHRREAAEEGEGRGQGQLLWEWQEEQQRQLIEAELELEEGSSSSSSERSSSSSSWEEGEGPAAAAAAAELCSSSTYGSKELAGAAGAGSNGAGSSSSSSSSSSCGSATLAERQVSHASASTSSSSSSWDADRSHHHHHRHHQHHDHPQQQPAPPPAAARGEDFLVVGEMSKIGRGMHTTRSVTLLQLPAGGAVADTPGFGLPTLEGVGSRQLGALFPEFEAAAEVAGRRCRFDDCMHVAEPGCVVLEAGLERHPYYLKFLAEVKAREELDERSLQASKRAREGNLKAVSGRGGRVRYEARLDSKRHRTVSRRRAKQQLAERHEGLMGLGGEEEEDA